MTTIKESIEAHIAAYPLPNLSWYQLFQDQYKYSVYLQWAKSHPLYGARIPLKHPIIYFTTTGRRREIGEVIGKNIERFGDSWRIAGGYCSKTYWVDVNNIAWEQLEKE